MEMQERPEPMRPDPISVPDSLLDPSTLLGQPILDQIVLQPSVWESAREEDLRKDPASSITRVYWSKKEGQILAEVLTNHGETATVTLDSLEEMPARLFTGFMAQLIRAEVGYRSKKRAVHFEDEGGEQADASISRARQEAATKRVGTARGDQRMQR